MKIDKPSPYLIWGSLLPTNVIFLYLGLIKIPSNQYSKEITPLLIGFFVVGLISAAVSLFFFRYLHFSKKFYSSKVVEFLDEQKKLPNTKEEYQNVYAKLYGVVMGLAGNAAGFGAIGFFVSKNFEFFISMLSISLLAELLIFPRPKKFAENILGEIE